MHSTEEDDAVEAWSKYTMEQMKNATGRPFKIETKDIVNSMVIEGQDTNAMSIKNNEYAERQHMHTMLNLPVLGSSSIAKEDEEKLKLEESTREKETNYGIEVGIRGGLPVLTLQFGRKKIVKNNYHRVMNAIKNNREEEYKTSYEASPMKDKDLLEKTRMTIDCCKYSQDNYTIEMDYNEKFVDAEDIMTQKTKTLQGLLNKDPKSILGIIAETLCVEAKNPAIVMIGPQSSGKSTIINRMLGKYVAPSQSNMCTTKLVRYNITRGLPQEIKVNGKKVNGEEDAVNSIKELMKGNIDSSEQIIVDIQGDYVEKTIIDTPGYKYDNQDDINKVKQIIDNIKVTKPKIFAVVEASSDIASNLGIARFEDSETQIVLNKCDKQVNAWSNNYNLDQYQGDYEKLWFVTGSYDNENRLSDDEENRIMYKNGLNWGKYEPKVTCKKLRNNIEKIYKENIDRFKSETLNKIEDEIRKADLVLKDKVKKNLSSISRDEGKKANERIKDIANILDAKPNTFTKELSRESITDEIDKLLTEIIVSDISYDQEQVKTMAGSGKTGTAEFKKPCLSIAKEGIRMIQYKYYKIGNLLYSKFHEMYKKCNFKTSDYVDVAVMQCIEAMLTGIENHWIEECDISSRTVKFSKNVEIIEYIRAVSTNVKILSDDTMKDLTNLENDDVITQLQQILDYKNFMNEKGFSDDNIKKLTNLYINNISVENESDKFGKKIQSIVDIAKQIVRAEALCISESFRKRLTELINFYLSNENFAPFATIVTESLDGAENIEDIREQALNRVNKEVNKIDDWKKSLISIKQKLRNSHHNLNTEDNTDTINSKTHEDQITSGSSGSEGPKIQDDKAYTP